MSAVHQIVRRYVKLVAENGPLAPRLRALGGKKQEWLNGEREPFAWVVDRATERVCESDLPPFVDHPDLWDLWPIFEHPLTDGRTALLVHRALDAARQEYKKQNSWSSTGNRGVIDTRRDRYTEAGQALVNEPTTVLARAEAEAAELAQIESRPGIEDAELADFEKAVAAWAAPLPLKERVAVSLLGQGLPDIEVNRRTKERFGRGVDRKRIAELWDHMHELAARLLTRPPTAAAPVIEFEPERTSDAPQVDAPSDTDAFFRTQDATQELGNGGSRAVSQTYANDENALAFSDGTRYFGGEADAADSANSRGGASASERYGKHSYDATQLGSGRGDSYGGDVTRLADQQRFASNFSEAELRALREQADGVDWNLLKIMADLSARTAKIKADAEAEAVPAEQLQQLDAAAQELYQIAARAQMSIQTLRDVLQAADRAEVSRGDIGYLIADLITFNDNRQAQEQKAQEQSRQMESSVRRKRRTKSVPVRVKARRRVVRSS